MCFLARESPGMAGMGNWTLGRANGCFMKRTKERDGASWERSWVGQLVDSSGFKQTPSSDMSKSRTTFRVEVFIPPGEAKCMSVARPAQPTTRKCTSLAKRVKLFGFSTQLNRCLFRPRSCCRPQVTWFKAGVAKPPAPPAPAPLPAAPVEELSIEE